MRIYHDVVCLPPGIRSVEFEKAFGYPGKFKTWEYLLMAGPYGKYLLEDCFHPDVQGVVFEYLDLIGLMWQKHLFSAAQPFGAQIADCTDCDDTLSASMGAGLESAQNDSPCQSHSSKWPLLGLGHVWL